MNTRLRSAMAIGVLGLGLLAQAGVSRSLERTRPPLERPLASLPLTLGTWSGRDLEVDPKIARESQATEYLSRMYVDQRDPSRQIWVWMNFSLEGLNLRHSPEICLPSGGWTKAESQTRVLPISCDNGPPRPICVLAYTKEELVQQIGFWYYIFGETQVERYFRSLPVTSRSSRGRTTRGSGLTVELFYPSDSSVDDAGLAEFASVLLAALEPHLPVDRATYHVP